MRNYAYLYLKDELTNWAANWAWNTPLTAAGRWRNSRKNKAKKKEISTKKLFRW